MGLKNLRSKENVKKISSLKNAWAAIFKNAEFSWNSSFFLIKNSFLSSLIMLAPSSPVNMESLEDGSVGLVVCCYKQVSLLENDVYS